jgi:hypothetical protein
MMRREIDDLLANLEDLDNFDHPPKSAATQTKTDLSISLRLTELRRMCRTDLLISHRLPQS